jgi:tetratricopeptide (TPR) repeat protein
MATPDESRLNDLKQRWARDPGSRLYLQLADEHRKLGQLEEAEAVLTKGLENRPSDLSGLVALGRVALERDKLDEALSALETVVGRDPAHIVANKLLLEAQLQKGDADKAGERLEICKLLNDRDPELEHLEYRLELLRSAAQPAPVSLDADILAAGLPDLDAFEASEAEPEAAAPEPEPEAAAPEPAPEPEAVAEPEPILPEPEPEPPASSDGDEIFQLGKPVVSPSLDSLWSSPSAEEPFGGLTPIRQFAEGDIFTLPPAAAPAPMAVTEPTHQAEAEPPPPDELDELTRPVAIRAPASLRAPAGGPVIHEELTGAALEEDEAEPETAAEAPAEPAADVDLEAPTQRVATVEVEAEDAEPVSFEPALEELSVPEPEVPEPEVPEPVVPEPEAGDEAVATVALGGLYLKQGHIDEAARIFRKVLERDPGNHAALAGLNLARKPKQGERLTAMDLLADRSLTGTIPAGLTAKKLLVLTNYLGQIRSAKDRQDVR